jgi:hypothetical protein
VDRCFVGGVCGQQLRPTHTSSIAARCGWMLRTAAVALAAKTAQHKDRWTSRCPTSTEKRRRDGSRPIYGLEAINIEDVAVAAPKKTSVRPEPAGARVTNTLWKCPVPPSTTATELADVYIHVNLPQVAFNSGDLNFATIAINTATNSVVNCSASA